MKIAINYRYGTDPTGQRNRLYIPGEFKEIFDELGIALIPIISNNQIDDIVDMCDALIVPGSYADTDPKYYNEKPLEGKNYDVDEYVFDRVAIEKFHNLNKPIIGICGGHQEINVFFGGTLYQRIENHNIDGLHKAILRKDSFIYDTFNKDEIDINSYHYQAIKDVAPGFNVTAVSEDGIIEAIEKDNIVCVQWHPEVLKDIHFFENFINKFVK